MTKTEVKTINEKIIVYIEILVLAGFAFIGAASHISRGDWFSMGAFVVLILLLIRDITRRVF